MTISERCRLRGFRILAANKEGGGGSSGKTDLEQLTEANDRIKALEGEKAAADQKAKDAEAKVTGLTTRAETAEADVIKLKGEVGTLTTRAETAEAEAKKAKVEQKGADEKAREEAAAMGVTAVAKTAEGQNGRSADDGKAIYEAYEKLMKDGESKAASAFWAKNEKALEAYAESLSKKQD
jgi:colicin import membrane protein